MSTFEWDRVVEEYLRQLDVALKGQPEGRRQQLVDEVRSHIAEGRALLGDPSEADIRTLLERLGTPEEIANESLIIDRATDPAPRRRLWLPVGIAAALVAAGLAVGLAVGLGGGTSGRRTVRPPASTTTTTAVAVLPTVRGESASGAADALSAVGVHITMEQAPSAVVAQGYVIKQAPAAGAKVALGSIVTLTVSSGPPPTGG